MVSDMLIMFSLYYYFKKSEVWLERRSKIIDKLILWTIETGLLTSLVALAQMICFLTMKSNLIYVSLYMVLPKLYSNCLMAMLNGRATLRNIPLTQPNVYDGELSNRRTVLTHLNFAHGPILSNHTS
ncbi:hypothetical protein BDZ94DRAFT_1253378 [Collybia nuda]|uniref:DUF6534 domain-containing protein n=1 Tax=Collybia nuda TaxID=64659 RepID=A0A9P5YD85_9AGAR|nr:hypothetical protein BDZ94DRAFT_1253378 [Collybia nuda]